MRKTLLIVDDQADMLEAMLSIASPAHWAVTTASDPDQAREILAGCKFDVVITDFKMGAKTGLDVLLAVRELHGTEVPVYLHTGEVLDPPGDFTRRYQKLEKKFMALLRGQE